MTPTTGARDARRSAETDGRATVGPYRLTELIGAGPYTRLYRARPLGCSSERPADYVVKTLRRKWATQRHTVQLLQREAFVGREVSHPHLISVLDADVNSPPFYLVTPFLTGATVKQVLARTGAIAPAPALWIARQTAAALGALHAAGWLHGDVKPANVFVSPAGHVTLLDLGFARRTDDTENLLDRPLMGTLHYVAPELLATTGGADHRSDFYSLGALLFEMLTGRKPFTANTPGALARAHLMQPPPDLRRLRPELSLRISRLLRRMLAKQPLRRPQTAGELIRLLSELEIESFDCRFAA